MKNSIKVMAVIAALCLTACGSTDSSAEDSGKLTLASSTTTTAAATEASADATTTTEAETTTTAEESKEADTTTTAADTEATTTTTTTAAATEATTTTTTTAAPAADPAPAAKETKFAVTYNGVTFNVGDTFSAIEQSLGKQAADPQKAQACIDDAPDSTQYYYPQMTIEVNNDKILMITLGDNFYNGDQTPKTAKGVAANGKLADLEAAYGKGDEDDGFGYRKYTDAASNTVMDVIYSDEDLFSITIHVPFN